MTLSFKTQINGKPTYFVEKIAQCLLSQMALADLSFYEKWYPIKLNENYTLCRDWYEGNIVSKLHTIRKDNANRWHCGRDIHLVIKNRTPDRFQFAPVVECLGVQKIDIKITSLNKEGKVSGALIWIDDNYLGGYNLYGGLPSQKDIELLAINDGFDDLEQFFEYFNTDFEGKIIHWTDLKY